MAGYKKAHSVSVALIAILKEYAARLGIDFVEISSAARFDLSTLGDGSTRVPAKHFEAMWKLIVAGNKDPHPGLGFGREMARHYPGGSILFTMMMNCPTIGCAIDTFIRYHRLMADIVQPQLRQNGERLHLTWQAQSADFPPHPDLSEAVICTYHCLLKHLSQGRMQPLEVCFSHSISGDIGVYRKEFQTTVRFNAERNELVIGRDSLQMEIHLANREIFEILENHAVRSAATIGGEKSWADTVMDLAKHCVLRGIKFDIDSVAKKLALSKRNLQAKLKVEKTTFRDCLETVRKQIAVDYLARPDTTSCDVAFLLGYSEQSAFNHAFKRWTGKSPKGYFYDATRHET